MPELEIKNAVITGTMLGIEDHGFLTAFIYLDYGGVSQGFGGHMLERSVSSSPRPYASLFICRVLKVVGVDTWEGLTGKPVRVKAGRTRIKALGHYLKNEWFDSESEFAKLDELLDSPFNEGGDA